MNDLKKISDEIKELLEKKRKDLNLTFEEEKHIYRMKDIDGKIKSNFPSVSKLIKKFHEPFDSNGKALQMSNGDIEAAQKLLLEWKLAGDYSTNMGSRVHYYLEKEIIGRNGDYKNVRKPIFEVDDTQIKKSDKMIEGGKKFLDLMEERGAVLLDTEMVLGHPELGYTGQPDKTWLINKKDNNGFGFIVTDWKSNQEKNFQPQPYNGYLFKPFQNFRDYALTHYYIQLPLYARLIIKMLEGTKYENTNLLGCIVVHLKSDGTFKEYRVPPEINNITLNLNLSTYVK